MDKPQFTTITLEQPWGTSDERVRIFPPCQIKDRFHEGNSVVVFARQPHSSSKAWRRRQIDNYGFFPKGGFVAWDDKNGEYAWHEIGTIDVPNAKDPDVPRPAESLPQFKPIIRGETEVFFAGAGGAPRQRDKSRTLRQRFMDWWAGKSRTNDNPLDFLRKDQ